MISRFLATSSISHGERIVNREARKSEVMYIMCNIGDNIRNARIRAHMTVQELAEKLSISHPALLKYEHGQALPNIATAYKMAQVLGVDMNSFVEGNSDES